MKDRGNLKSVVSLRLEGFITSSNGYSVDLGKFLEESIWLGRRGLVSCGIAPDQFVIETNLSSSLESHEEDLNNLFTQLNRVVGPDNIIRLVSKRPNGFQLGGALWNKDLQRKALLESLRDSSEGGKDAQGVFALGDTCRAGISFDFMQLSDRAVLACNLLNLAAPAVMKAVSQKYQLGKTDFSKMWGGFARSERLPSPQWFSSYKSYRDKYESLLRLIKVSSINGSEWVVDLINSQSLSEFDLVAEQTTWWLGRLKPSESRVEYLALPAMEFNALLETAADIDLWLNRSLAVVGHRLSENGYDHFKAGKLKPFLDQALPTSDEEWWEMWRSV